MALRRRSSGFRGKKGYRDLQSIAVVRLNCGRSCCFEFLALLRQLTTTTCPPQTSTPAPSSPFFFLWLGMIDSVSDDSRMKILGLANIPGGGQCYQSLSETHLEKLGAVIRSFALRFKGTLNPRSTSGDPAGLRGTGPPSTRRPADLPTRHRPSSEPRLIRIRPDMHDQYASNASAKLGGTRDIGLPKVEPR